MTKNKSLSIILILTLLISMLLSACQPIQPGQSSSPSAQSTPQAGPAIPAARLEDDYYGYVNADFLAQPLPEDLVKTGPMYTLMQGNVRTALLNDFERMGKSGADSGAEYMQSAMIYYTLLKNVEQREKDGTAPVKPFIQRIEGIKTLSELGAATPQMLREGLPMPFMADVIPDSQNSSRQLLVFAICGLLLETVSDYEDNAKTAPLHKAMEDSSVKLLTLYGYSQADAERMTKEFMEFERIIASHSLTAEATQEDRSKDNRVEPKVWAASIKNTNFEAIITELAGTLPERILVYNGAFFEKYDTVVNEVNLPRLKSWMIVQTLIQAAPHLSSNVAEALSALDAAKGSAASADEDSPSDTSATSGTSTAAGAAITPDAADMSEAAGADGTVGMPGQPGTGDSSDSAAAPDKSDTSADTDAEKAQEAQSDAYTGVEEVYGPLIGYYYARTHLDDSTREVVTNMVKDIMAEYRTRLQANTWLSPTTKDRALLKLDKMTYTVGYPDQVPSFANLANAPAADIASVYGCFITIQKESRRMKFENLEKPVDRNDLTQTQTNLHEINSSYMPLQNRFYIYAGILQKPMFDPSASESANYGGIGFVIGHELSHAFDSLGSLYDENGNKADWWTQEDRAAFQQRVDKMVKLFDGIPYEGGKVNGTQTVAENTADSGGLSTSIAVLKNKNGHSLQEFFESFAKVWALKQTPESAQASLLSDVHSPDPVRVNRQCSNCDDFYTVYQIAPTDKMYLAPENRVQVW